MWPRRPILPSIVILLGCLACAPAPPSAAASSAPGEHDPRQVRSGRAVAGRSCSFFACLPRLCLPRRSTSGRILSSSTLKIERLRARTSRQCRPFDFHGKRRPTNSSRPQGRCCRTPGTTSCTQRSGRGSRPTCSPWPASDPGWRFIAPRPFVASNKRGTGWSSPLIGTEARAAMVVAITSLATDP